MPFKMTRKFLNVGLLLLTCCSFWITPLSSQIGGLATFDFLNLTSSARATALGGYPIAVSDDDVSLGYLNPALISSKMSHRLSINQNFHFADISHGFIAYGLDLPSKKISLIFGVNYVNYGEFQRADLFGNRIGEFSGSESAITIGISRKLDERLRVGLNLKYANSRLDTYGSSGIGADLGFHYSNPEKMNTWALVFRNIGVQFSSFGDHRESFPFDLQLGFSKRLAHLPFRFMVTAHHLQKWNLRSPLDDVGQVILIDQTASEPSSLSKATDNFFRHLAFGGELLIGKNEVVRLRFGYNHLRNKELSVSNFRSLSGFNFGIGIKVKKITFDYGVGRFHLAGAVNHISASINLTSLFEKI